MFEIGQRNNDNNYVDEKYKEDKEKLMSLIEESKKDVMKTIESFGDFKDSSDLQSIVKNGFKVTVGNKILNFNLTEVEELEMDQVREELKKLYQEKLYNLREVINEKFYALSESYESIKEKLEDELEKSKETNSKFVMPDITLNHANDGLSVVRGEENDELHWLFRGIYRVETVDDINIDPEMSKRTETPAIIMISTKDNKVTNVKIKSWGFLKNFSHYHSISEGSSDDCWGNWEYYQNWETPEDIIEIGKHAFAILRNVNTDSPGDESPAFLPPLGELVEAKINNSNDLNYNSEVTERLQGRNESNYIWNINDL